MLRIAAMLVSPPQAPTDVSTNGRLDPRWVASSLETKVRPTADEFLRVLDVARKPSRSAPWLPQPFSWALHRHLHVDGCCIARHKADSHPPHLHLIYSLRERMRGD